MSEANNILPKTVAAVLKCVQCKQYLSVPPITFKSGDYQCGRCQPTVDIKQNESHQATAYESLAQVILFPCRYDTFGCNSYLNFKETKSHEKTCKFRTITCPAITCKAEIKVYDIMSHFQEMHKELIMYSNKFSISYVQNCLVNKLMMLDDEILLLEMVSESSKFWLGLRHFDRQHQSQELLYQLEVKSSSSNVLVLNRQQIIEYSPETSSLNSKMISFDCDIIKTVLQSEDFTFEIRLVTDNLNKNKSNSENFLEELECIVCKEYMVPPVYICKTGHSLCSDCKNKMQECPMCKERFEGARNFALEKLTDRIDYPCKNQSKGCTYIGNAKNIRTHEINCLTKVIHCPLREFVDCNWKGLFHEIYSHTKKRHPFFTWFKFNQTVYYNLNSRNIIHCYIATCDDNTFKVCVKHEKNTTESVSWAVEHIELSSNDSPKFEFILDFLDQTGTDRRLTINNLCYGLQNRHDQLFNNCTQLSYKLLKPFIKSDGKLIYSVNIKRVENLNQELRVRRIY